MHPFKDAYCIQHLSSSVFSYYERKLVRCYELSPHLSVYSDVKQILLIFLGCTIYCMGFWSLTTYTIVTEVFKRCCI